MLLPDAIFELGIRQIAPPPGELTALSQTQLVLSGKGKEREGKKEVREGVGPQCSRSIDASPSARHNHYHSAINTVAVGRLQ